MKTTHRTCADVVRGVGWSVHVLHACGCLYDDAGRLERPCDEHKGLSQADPLERDDRDQT